MNILGIDYGTKRVGLAISINQIISPIGTILNVGDNVFEEIKKIVKEQKIQKIYIGISEGEMAKKTLLFVGKLSHVINLPIETVDEAVSTIEADAIYLANKNKKNDYKKNIDSVAAAVILSRVIS